MSNPAPRLKARWVVTIEVGNALWSISGNRPYTFVLGSYRFWWVAWLAARWHLDFHPRRAATITNGDPDAPSPA